MKGFPDYEIELIIKPRPKEPVKRYIGPYRAAYSNRPGKYRWFCGCGADSGELLFTSASLRTEDAHRHIRSHNQFFDEATQSWSFNAKQR